MNIEILIRENVISYRQSQVNTVILILTLSNNFHFSPLSMKMHTSDSGKNKYTLPPSLVRYV